VYSLTVVVAGTLLYLLFLKKSSHFSGFPLYMLSLSAIVVSCLMYAYTSYVFQFRFQLDQYLYLKLSGLKLPIRVLSRFYNLSVAFFMFSSFLTIKRLQKYSYLKSAIAVLCIILFVQLNDIDTAKYVHIMANRTDSTITRTFWNEIAMCIKLYTEILFLYFILYPVIILIAKSVKNRIYLNRRNNLFLLAIVSVIHGYAFLTLKSSYAGLWCSHTGMSKIPSSMYPVPGSFILPIFLVLMFVAIAIFAVKIKPKGSIKLLTSSQWIEQNTSLSDGIGMAFHTHKNALLAIRQHLELIHIYMNKNDQDKILEHLDISHSVINNQLNSIQKTLKNLQNNKIPARQVDLSECIRDAIKKFSFDGYLELNLLDGCVVMGDNDALCEVFLNALFNAEYALKDKEDKQIKVKMINEDDYIEVDIWDNGCGISKENLRHVFTPFFSTKPALHFGGLGLSSIRSTIGAHRGDVIIKSKEDQFTVIKMVFPAYTNI